MNKQAQIDSNNNTNNNDNDGEHHASKKIKLSNDTTIKNEKKKELDELLDECWVKVRKLGFYLEIPRSDASLRNSRIYNTTIVTSFG